MNSTICPRPPSPIATARTPMSRVAIRGLALLLVASVAGCLTPKAPLEIEAPRKFSATSPLKNVTIVPFEGLRGEQTLADVRRMLERTKVRGKSHFTIVEGRRLDNVRKELDRVRQGRFTRVDLAKIQEQSGAQAVVSGRVVEASIKDTRFREHRDRCAQQENTWRGVLLQKCEQGKEQKVEISCVKRDARFTLQPEMRSLETGDVVFTDRYSRSKSASHCEDAFGEIARAKDMLDELAELVISDIEEDLTPVVSVVKVPLKRLEKSAGASAAQAEMFASAIDFAQSERFDRACEIWKGLHRDGVGGIATQYNLAVCAESAGRADDALAILTKTDRLLDRPDEQINRYLHRLREQIAQRDESARSYRNVMARHEGGDPVALRGDRHLQQTQARLNGFGYDCGTADGVIGPKTRQCLAQYQKKHGLKVTGTLTSQLLGQLGIGASQSSAPARIPH